MDVNNWTPKQVTDWLTGLCDDPDWINVNYVLNNNICGRELLMMSACDLFSLGATKVDLQERLLEAIEKLRFYNSNVNKETLQISMLRLACQARSLHRQLVADRQPETTSKRRDQPNSKVVTLSREFIHCKPKENQRVSLDTLVSVSAIVRTVRQITDTLNSAPFSKHGDYRSMKSLLLALSIELTSTAQRDQFVESPNDIIEKSSKALADYCDRIAHGTNNILSIQPFQLEQVELRKGSSDADVGLIFKLIPNDGTHLIEKIAPLSPANKTNKLNVGDEVIRFNKYIVGWTPRNVQRLLIDCLKTREITLLVKKCPRD